MHRCPRRGAETSEGVGGPGPEGLRAHGKGRGLGERPRKSLEGIHMRVLIRKQERLIPCTHCFLFLRGGGGEWGRRAQAAGPAQIHPRLSSSARAPPPGGGWRPTRGRDPEAGHWLLPSQVSQSEEGAARAPALRGRKDKPVRGPGGSDGEKKCSEGRQKRRARARRGPAAQANWRTRDTRLVNPDLGGSHERKKPPGKAAGSARGGGQRWTVTTPRTAHCLQTRPPLLLSFSSTSD